MEPANDPHSRKALAASLLLHIGLLLVLTRVNMPPLQPAPPVARPLLVVSVAASNPQRASARPETQTAIPAEAAAPTLANPGQSETSAVTKPAPAQVKKSASSNRVPLATQPPLPSPEPAALDPATLQGAITASVRAVQRTSLQSVWTQPCKRYREPLEHDNCPPDEEIKTARQAAIDHNTSEVFLTWAHAKARDERRTKELNTEMDRWRPLMNDNTVVGKIASESYYLAKAKRDYVNPEVVGGMIPYVAFNGNKIIVLAGLLTIGLDGEVTVNDEQLYGPARSAHIQK